MLHLVSMTADEAAVERNFSAMGNIQTKHRSCLGVDKMHKTNTVRMELRRNHIALGLVANRSKRVQGQSKTSAAGTSLPTSETRSLNNTNDDSDLVDFTVIAAQLVQAVRDSEIDEPSETPEVQDDDELTWAPSQPVHIPSIDYIPPNAKNLAAQYRRAQPSTRLADLFNYTGAATSSGIRGGLDFFWSGAYNDTVAEAAEYEGTGTDGIGADEIGADR